MTSNGVSQVQPDLNGEGSARPSVNRAVKCYYIDELGFYRHLDPDQQQYVCSNISATTIRKSLRKSPVLTNGQNKLRLHQQEQKISAADGGYEISSKAMRRALGISHFDRVDDYSKWKKSWDDFMRDKLTSRQPVTLNRELKARVRSGIPHDYRCKVWSAMIRMRTHLIRSQFGDDIYETILRDFVSKISIPHYTKNDSNNNSSSSGSKQVNGAIREDIIPTGGVSPYVKSNRSPKTGDGHVENSRPKEIRRSKSPETYLEKCFKQIELDLLRTLPNNVNFENPNSEGIRRVRRVLRAYACFNRSVGYCQGMNRLAAMSLLVLPEEEAFWCLVAIIQCIMPKDYYLKPWLAQVDCCVLGDLLEKKMPKLHRHLAHNDIQLTLFTWFFTIFVDGFRPELMLRIWDCFLLEGDKILFRVALSILYISQDELMKMNDFSTMSSHLGRIVSTRQLETEQLFEGEYT